MPKVATFTLSVSPVAGMSLVANYATRDGSAQAGVDYEATSGTVIFEEGETEKQVVVPIFFDTKGGDFYLDTSWADPSDKTVNRATGMACIKYEFGPGNAPNMGDGYDNQDDGPGGDGSDGTPVFPNSIRYLSIADGSLFGGKNTARFVVTISPAPTEPMSMDYNTRNGTGVGGTDYATSNGSIVFAPGTPFNVIDVPILVPDSGKDFNVDVRWTAPSRTKIVSRPSGKMIIPYVPPPVVPILDMLSTLDWITTTNVTVRLPPEGKPGSLLVVTFSHAFASGQYTPPPGWTMQHQYIGREHLAVAFKVRGVNEPDPVFTRSGYTYGIWFVYEIYGEGGRPVPTILDASNHQSITTAQASYICAGITTSKPGTFLFFITAARLVDTVLITNNGPDSSTGMQFSNRIQELPFENNRWEQLGGAYNTGNPLIYRAYGGLWMGQGPTGQVAYPSPGGNTPSTSFLLAFKTP